MTDRSLAVAMRLNPYITFDGDAAAAMQFYAEGMGEYVRGNNVQVSLSGDNAEALHGYWDGLSDGAQVIMPLEKQVWGDEYGQLVDKFGILWHVNIGSGENVMTDA